MNKCPKCGEIIDWSNPNIHYAGHVCYASVKPPEPVEKELTDRDLRIKIQEQQEEIWSLMRENDSLRREVLPHKPHGQNELGHLRSHLLWALQMLQEGYTVSDHICGFTHAPDTGHCEFCDKYGKAISVLGLEGRA